ncbi:hypothetical protein BV20DRAFT_974467 [Pilatotrama ljubarskyi]|nr:hypothetical protein BV20DRAFT_974467 [Pilatotrama ljubarskyi]
MHTREPGKTSGERVGRPLPVCCHTRLLWIVCGFLSALFLACARLPEILIWRGPGKERFVVFELLTARSQRRQRACRERPWSRVGRLYGSRSVAALRSSPAGKLLSIRYASVSELR